MTMFTRGIRDILKKALILLEPSAVSKTIRLRLNNGESINS